SPLVIGLGIGENFIASDSLALLPVTRRFIYLEEGDVAEISRTCIQVYDKSGSPVERQVQESSASYDAGDKGPYRHYMLKEIFEQPQAVSNTLEARIHNGAVIDSAFGADAGATFARVRHVQIVAC